MKKLHVLLTALLMTFMLAACGNGEQQVKENEQTQTPNVEEQTQGSEIEEAFPVTLTDSAGKEVVLEKQPEKVVSLMPSNTEIIYALESGDTIVGVTESDNYPEEVTDVEKVMGLDMTLNIEKIISLNPDLVLAHGSGAAMYEEGLAQLEESNIPVYIVQNAESLEETFMSIQAIGQALGQTEEATNIVTDMKAKLADIEEKAKAISEADQKSVYVEISPAPELFAAGQGTFMDEMLQTIHAKNAVDMEGWPQLSEEEVIQTNPDVIIVNYSFVENPVEEVLGRAAWQDITAVKEKKVYQVNEDLVSRPGPRIVEGVEELAKSIYPEVYGE